MGYRSEIKICMRKENFNELKKIFKDAEINQEIEPAEAKLMEYIDECKELDNDIVIFGWSWVKWYSEYADVQIVMNYLDVLMDAQIPFKYIRLGEDTEDVDILEFYGDGECDRIGYVREIEIY